MKEYMPGQGSYKVEEAGALTGIPTSYNVDDHFGTLIFDRDDIVIPASGIDIALSARFNSDHFYSTVIPRVAKNDGPAGRASVGNVIPNSLMTLPLDQTNFYRIANGWSWKLPWVLLGVSNAFKFSLGDGRIFDLSSCLTFEAWGNTPSAGHHCWTEGYEVTYDSEDASQISTVTIIIPEIQGTIVVPVQRSSLSPFDFTPLLSASGHPNFKVYLADGKALSFNENGFLSAISDSVGKNSLTFSYLVDAYVGMTQDARSRRNFRISQIDYDNCLPGDLIVIGDEIKSIFSRDGGGWITVSGSFDVYIPESSDPPPNQVQYKILHGQLQRIVHTDGRAAKFYYYTHDTQKQIVCMLSSDTSSNDTFNVGDQFLGCYSIGLTNNLTKYWTLDTKNAPAMPSGFVQDLQNNQINYFSYLQSVTYDYYVTTSPSPSTDRIVVTNHVGAPTIYYFQRGAFCSHSWTNTFFHRGSCRRGSTQTTVMIERPDFYITPGNWININRVDDNAFWQASKDDYQQDENAAEFNDETEYSKQMYLAQQALSATGVAAGIISAIVDPKTAISSLFGAAQGLSSMGLAADQYNHTIQKYKRDADIAKNAPPVSKWVPVDKVTSPNRLTTSQALTQSPRQNDVYAVVGVAIDGQLKVSRTSRNSTRIYVDWSNNDGAGGPQFQVGDYILLRTEMQKIAAADQEEWADAVSKKYVEVETAFQFMPEEGEWAAFVQANHLPPQPEYWVYYLNKPKVVRIEIRNTLAPVGTDYWKRIDYEYFYEVQGSAIVDSFIDGGFTEGNVDGPYSASIESSDISLKSTVITTGISNVDEDIDMLREVYEFEYDAKSFHKGCSSVTKLRQDTESTSWFFVSRSLTLLGRPCFNAGYYGPMIISEYEGGDIHNLADGGNAMRRKISFRYDVYGRTVRKTVFSPYFEGRKSQTIWTQYVGSSPYLASQGIPDLDPLKKFSENYLGGNYQQIFDTFHIMNLVGATIEEIDAYGNMKTTYNGYDFQTGNLTIVDSVVLSSLNSFNSIYSENHPNFVADFNSTHVDDESRIWWNAGGSDQNDWSTAIFGDSDVTSHAVTLLEYDSETNNLTKITKPLGNEINMSYGSAGGPSWKKSYITLDYKLLNNNIGGNSQYIVTSYDYDLRGRLIQKIVRFKTDAVDDDNNLVSYGIHASKTVVKYNYDGMNRLLVKELGPDSTVPVLKRHYFDSGDASWLNPFIIDTDYLGFRTKSYYDSLYRLLRVKKYKPSHSISGDLDYPSSDEIEVSSELNTYQPGIEKIAQNIKYTDPSEGDSHQTITKNSYDNLGRLLRIEYKNTDSDYQGDAVFRVLQEIDYDDTANAIITKKYVDDIVGNFAQSRVENSWLGFGAIKEFSWAGLNGTGVKRAMINHYRHDGKLIKRDLPNRDSYLYNYNTLGMLEMITYPDGTRSATIYDLNGNIAQTIDRRNFSTIFEYNASDLLVRKNSADSVHGDTVITLTHTQYGPAKALKMEDATSIVEIDSWYHFAGGICKRRQSIDSYAMEIDATFDAAGNQISVTPVASGASPWTRTFNILPQFHPVTDTDHFNRVAVADDSTGKNIITHEPDFLGLTKTIKYGDYDAVVSSVAHAYDKFLRLRSITNSESTPKLNVTLSRDFLGNILSHTEPALAPSPALNDSYAYDGMTRLLSGEGSSQTYDELSNLVTKGSAAYAYQDPNNLTGDQMRLDKFTLGGVVNQYSYDANGNPLEVTNRFSSLSYDNLNMLRQIIYSQTDDYWYSDDGLRVKKTENVGGTWKTTYTLFEGNNPLLQEIYDASGHIQTTFNIIVAGKILAQYKMVYPSTQSVVYFYLDNLNSRRAVLDSSGNVIDRIRYSAWGVATQDGEPPGSVFGPLDAETADTSQFSSVQTDGSCSLIANPDIKCHGSYAFKVTADGSTLNCFGKKDFPTAVNEVYIRTYLYVPSSFDIPHNKDAWVITLGGGGGTHWNAGLGFKIADDGSLQWSFDLTWGSATVHNSSSNAFDTWHCLELRYLVDSSAGGGEAWVDGQKIFSDLTHDTTVTGEYVLIGTYGGPNTFSPTAGRSIYIDDVKADGMYIGAYGVRSGEYRSFTGKEHDATGLIYFNARYYDPLTGRFLTEDPSRQGVNWYAYCENNPVNKTDPTGMEGGFFENLLSSIKNFFSPAKATTPTVTQPAQNVTTPLPVPACGASCDIRANNAAYYAGYNMVSQSGSLIDYSNLTVSQIFSQDFPSGRSSTPIPGGGLAFWGATPTSPKTHVEFYTYQAGAETYSLFTNTGEVDTGIIQRPATNPTGRYTFVPLAPMPTAH